MSIAAAINKKELTKSVRFQFVGSAFQVALINSPGTVYSPSTTISSTFLQNEITAGTAGYQRQNILYTDSDVQAYTDEGVPLARKGAVFTHDGGTTTYQFTHVALLRIAQGTGSISGTTLTISNTTYNGFDAGYTLTGGSIPSGTYISALGTGVGSNGTYVLNQAVTQASTTITGAEIVSVAALASQAIMSDGNQAVFYYDLKQFGYYQV